MNSFGVFDRKTSNSESFLPKPNIGTPNNQPFNPVMRRLEFEDDSNSNSPVTQAPTKSFTNLFLKKERKHYSDPVQLKSKTFPNPFDSSLGLTSLKSPKKELVDILQESESKTTLGESLNGSPSAETSESKNETSLMDGIEPKFDVYQRKKSNSQGSFYHLTEKIKVLQEAQPSFCSEILDLSTDLARNLSLSTSKNTRDPDLNTISPQTVASLLYNTDDQNYLIVDCRYPYEYKGGHIKGALHIESPQLLEQIFFTYKHLLSNPQYLQDLKKDMTLTLSKIESYTTSQTVEQQNSPTPNDKDPPLIIFHCEFSQKRGPRVFRAFRARDREINEKKWPHLDFQEIYVLEGGYCNFYSQFPEHCEGDYIKMADKRFKKEYSEAKDASKKVWKKSLNAVDVVVAE